MNRSRLSSLVCPTLAVALLTLTAGTAAAQGTMTPSQPPTGTPNQPPPGTPNQPPPEAPPTVAPAQPAQPGPAPAGPAPEGEEPSDAPKARTGFQMAIRTGASIPLGSVTGVPSGSNADNPKMSDYVSTQFALILDIGAKIIPNLFIGGYLGLGIGGAGGNQADVCDKNNLSCSAVSLRIGIQAQFHFIPDGKINPWAGYGIGYEATSLSASANGNSSSLTATGVEFGHLMGGVDFRITRVFGVGPFLDLGIGQYGSLTGSGSNSNSSVSNDIKDKALHEWLTIGGKFTFWP